MEVNDKFDELEYYTELAQENQDLLHQKRSRATPTQSNNLHNNINSSNASNQNNLKNKNIETNKIQSPDNNMGVKLICDSSNEDMKKYFSKTKLYTNDDITLDYFSKYICFKQNFPSTHKEKISFYIFKNDNVR